MPGVRRKRRALPNSRYRRRIHKRDGYGLRAHTEETKRPSGRLERIFSEVGEGPVRAENPVMEGVFRVGQQVVEESEDRDVKDSGFVAALQLGQHHEVAGYGMPRIHAEALGPEESAHLLRQALDKKRAEDGRLTELA